jgi:hypothetical protein
MHPPPVALIGLLSLVSVPMSHAGGLGHPITISIVNPGFDERMIEVVDNICRQVVVSATLVRESSVMAHVCTRGMDRADVTIRNPLTGASHHYPDVLRGAQLSAP